MRVLLAVLVAGLTSMIAFAQAPSIDTLVDQRLPALVSTYKMLHAAP